MTEADAGPVLVHGKCKFCQHPIVWGLLQNGRRRSFEPQLYPAADVAEGDRFAVHRRYGRVVDLVGHPSPPAQVLLTHRCAEYVEARRMRGVSDLGEAAAEIFKGSP